MRLFVSLDSLFNLLFENVILSDTLRQPFATGDTVCLNLSYLRLFLGHGLLSVKKIGQLLFYSRQTAYQPLIFGVGLKVFMNTFQLFAGSTVFRFLYAPLLLLCLNRLGNPRTLLGARFHVFPFQGEILVEQTHIFNKRNLLVQLFFGLLGLLLCFFQALFTLFKGTLKPGKLLFQLFQRGAIIALNLPNLCQSGIFAVKFGRFLGMVKALSLRLELFHFGCELCGFLSERSDLSMKCFYILQPQKGALRLLPLSGEGGLFFSFFGYLVPNLAFPLGSEKFNARSLGFQQA